MSSPVLPGLLASAPRGCKTIVSEKDLLFKWSDRHGTKVRPNTDESGELLERSSAIELHLNQDRSEYLEMCVVPGDRTVALTTLLEWFWWGLFQTFT